MNNLKMTSTIMQITAIKKPTKAKFFKDFKIGTRFSISMQVVNPGHGRGLYASYINIINHTTNISDARSITDLVNRLTIFDFIEEQTKEELNNAMP